MSLFGLLNHQQARGRDVAARRRSGAAAGQAGESRPCRHARSAGHRRAGGRHRPGDAAGRVRAANAQAVSGDVSARPHERRPRTSKARSLRWPTRPCRRLLNWNRAAQALTGEIQQRPPAFSALKVDGRRAYALRSGRRSGRAGAAPGSGPPAGNHRATTIPSCSSTSNAARARTSVRWVATWPSELAPAR